MKIKIFFIICTFLIYPLIANATPHPKKILLVVAMHKEANPIITQLHLQKINHTFSNLPMQAYRGNFHNLSIMLIENGIDPLNQVQNTGTQPATLTTYLGISWFHPDLVISIGTAGGVASNQVQLKDIFISKKIYFFARRIPFPKDKEYGLGGYTSFAISALPQLKSGIICSGDSFDQNQTDYENFLKLHCSAVDMEAAGVAWVSMLMQTPMFAMKGVTNFVRGDGVLGQYRENFVEVSERLVLRLEEVLQNLT